MTDWQQFREGSALRESGKPAEALAKCEELRKSAIDPEDVSSILLGESLAYCQLGQFDKAAEAASEAVSLLPEESPSRPYAEFSLSCVHEQNGKFDVAAEGFRTLLKKRASLLRTAEYIPFGRGVQLRLIASLIVLGHALEPLSIADALKAEDISSEERGELSYREAQAHRLLGRHDLAVSLYKEAINGPLEDSLAARAHFHIAEVLYDRGEFREALDEFKNAEKRVEPENPDRGLFTKWIEHTKRKVTDNKSGADRPI